MAAVLVLAGCGGSSAGTAHSSAPGGSRPLAPSGPHSAVLRKIHTGGTPCGVAGQGNDVWVSDAQSAALWRVDRVSGTVTKAATLDPTPCAITVAYASLWIVTQSGRLDRVDPISGRVTARIKVGATSYQAVATPGAIWVSNRNGASLSRIDPGTDKVTRTVGLPGAFPGGMAYAGGALWVGDDNSAASKVIRIDLHTLAARRFSSGTRPAYLAAVAGKLWVSNQLDGTVSQLDAASGARLATVPAGTSPVNLTGLSGTEVWVPDDKGDRMTRIDARTAKVIETVPAVRGPAIVTAVAGDVWVSMFGAGSVWQVHPASR